MSKLYCHLVQMYGDSIHRKYGCNLDGVIVENEVWKM